MFVPGFLLLSSYLIGISNSANIIALIPIGSKSHKNVFKPLVQELAARGHKVTIVSPYKENTATENVQEIVLTNNAETIRHFSKKVIEATLDGNPISLDFDFMLTGSYEFYQDPTVKEILQRGKQFDLAIVSGFLNDFAFVTASFIAKHVIILQAASIMFPFPSAPPSPLATLNIIPKTIQPKCEYLAHVQKVILGVAIWNIYKYKTYGLMEQESENVFGQPLSIDEAKKRISLILVNADPVMADARPEMTNFIPVGGIHCKPAKPLLQDLYDFVESSGEDGFILFSLGSVMQGKYLSKDIRNAFSNSFSRLKQKVLWKFEEKMDEVPSNIMITPWTPQQDVLGHPKIRLFITHGGLLSLQEAIYHGVPVIGIPIFAEQPINVDRILKLGIGETLSLANITTEEIYSKIQKMLSTPRQGKITSLTQ